MINWPSPAKLNLFLYITGRREDGYHNLQTLFHFINYCDYLTFTPRNDNQLVLQTHFDNVEPEKNLIYLAASLLHNYAVQQNITLPHPFGMDITIDKKLPMGGGLGGGSSNAATTFVALNKLWQLQLSKAELMQLGCQIGADVPIFIYGHSAFAQGVGDQLQSVDIAEKWYLIVKPNIAISTVSIFTHPNLKRDSVTRSVDKLLNSPFENDCQEIVCQLYPQISALIKLLAEYAPTRLTGTGACIFTVCDTESQAVMLQNMIDQFDSTLESFIAKGINQSPLYNQ